VAHNKTLSSSGPRLWLLALGSGLLLLVGVLIVSAQRSLARLEKDIGQLNTQLAAQEILFPLYQKLTGELQAAELPLLPLPDRTELRRDRVAEVPIIFADMARGADMQATRVIPELVALSREAGFFKVDVVVRGDFFAFRQFLTALGEIPYLRQIEEIQIEAQPASKEYRLKLWLAMSK